MSQRQLKAGYFVLEGLNSFSTVVYAYYLYFFMEKTFGFGNRANLALAALNGALCMFSSWFGGRFSQRFGYFTALKLGFTTMALALAIGSQVTSALAQILVMAAFITGMCFTWPTLEALVSEAEPPGRLPHMVGLYNVVWAGTAALAYFTGGAMLDKWGLKSIFYVPAAMLFGQLVLTFWLQARDRALAGASDASQTPSREQLESTSMPELNPRPIARAKNFRRLAWLANPFAYVAINTVIALMPGLAGKLGLTATLVGFFCSFWCFARLAAFAVLWWWPGWHYRFGWLLAAYLALVASFAGMLLSPALAWLLAAQVVFGGALGLIYYSSLFYSMDLSDTKGKHGGIHEAAIGLGNFAGPAVGAAAFYFLPQYSNSGTIAVSALMLLGLGALLTIRGKE
jgi:predicted MFS family arabinose efflux permease